jgi:hypothetical protein
VGLYGFLGFQLLNVCIELFSYGICYALGVPLKGIISYEYLQLEASKGA